MKAVIYARVSSNRPETEWTTGIANLKEQVKGEAKFATLASPVTGG